LVVKAVRDGVSLSADGIGKVQLSEFELDQGPFQKERQPTREELAEFMVGLFGNANPYAISHHRPREAAIVAVIESEKPDKVIDGVYRALKDSAQRQFTGQRPALLAVRLTDLTKAHLDELAARTETAWPRLLIGSSLAKHVSICSGLPSSHGTERSLLRGLVPVYH
jgi:hypothetical protein